VPFPPHVPPRHLAPLRPPGRRGWLAVGLLVALTTLPTLVVLAAGRSALHVPWRQHDSYRADNGPIVVTDPDRVGGPALIDGQNAGGAGSGAMSGTTQQPVVTSTHTPTHGRTIRTTREEDCPTVPGGVGGGTPSGGFPAAQGVPAGSGSTGTGSAGAGSTGSTGSTGSGGAGSAAGSGATGSGATTGGNDGAVPAGGGSSTGSSTGSPAGSAGGSDSGGTIGRPTESQQVAPGAAFTDQIFDGLGLPH
jgi:hypothetical protein